MKSSPRSSFSFTSMGLIPLALPSSLLRGELAAWANGGGVGRGVGQVENAKNLFAPLTCLLLKQFVLAWE